MSRPSRGSARLGARWCRCLLSAFVLLAGALAGGAAQESGEAAARPPPERPALRATESVADGNYGRTPEAAIPYRDFPEPYTRFYKEKLPFRGAGRAEESAPGTDTVKIGLLVPSDSAPDAHLGLRMREGITLAIEQANAAGGFQGIPFEVVVREESGLWGASASEMVAFKTEDDVLAVMGSIDGANTHIALRAALKLGLPMVNTATTDPTLTETNIPWIVRCMADDRQQGYALTHHIFGELGIERTVVFRVNDRYGRTGVGEFRDAARRLRHPVLAELRWDPGERDFTRQLDRIAALTPEAIILWGNAADTAAIVREIRRRRMPVRVFGCDRMASQAFLEAAGVAADGVVTAATYDPTRADPRLAVFVEAFTARFGVAPETFAAHAYDGARLLIAAIRTAGLNRVRLRDALYDYERFDGVTGPIVFDTTLNDIGPVYLATAREGRWSYREARFAGVDRHARQPRPYRTVAQAPPVARSPARESRAAGKVMRVGCFLPMDARGQAALRGMRRAIAADAAQHPDDLRIELVPRDARGAWGENTTALVELVVDEDVVALLGSTERRGTHLAQMLAAKLHFPVVTLCGSDPTITRIPMPWVFCVAPGTPSPGDSFGESLHGKRDGPDPYEALGADAVGVVIAGIRAGARSRRALRDAIATGGPYAGGTGVFAFDPLGNRTGATGQAVSP